LPLTEEDPPPEDALALEPPDAAVVELEDEHAAVTPSSSAAAAPAAGIDKDRFIPAPLEILDFDCRPRVLQGLPRESVRARTPPYGMFSFWQPCGNI
jgi:hypothetical protein